MKQLLAQVSDSFRKSAVLSVMIILTFSAGLFLIGGTISYITASRSLSNRFEKVYSSENGRYMFYFRNWMGEVSNENGEQVLKSAAAAYEQVKAEYPQYQFYNFASLPLLIGGFKGDDRMLNGYSVGRPQRDISEDEGVKYSNVIAQEMPQEFIEHFLLRVSEGTDFSQWKGQTFTASDGAEIPVILGNGFRGAYSLGDVLPGRIMIYPAHVGLRLRVVGFFEKGCAFLSINSDSATLAGSSVAKAFVYLDDMVVLPFLNLLDYRPDLSLPYIEGNYRMILATQYSHYLMTADTAEGHPDEEIAPRIEELAGGKIEIIGGSVMSIPKAFYAQRDLYFNLMLYSSIFIVFACVVCISINLTNKISSNLKKYAVHLISGASLSTLRSFAVGEVAAVTVISNALAFSGLLLFGGRIFTYGSSTYAVTLSGVSATSALTMLAVDACVIAFSLIYPLIKINRTEYDTLLRGDE